MENNNRENQKLGNKGRQGKLEKIEFQIPEITFIFKKFQELPSEYKINYIFFSRFEAFYLKFYKIFCGEPASHANLKFLSAHSFPIV